MDLIQKLELQTEEVTEVKPLEKHSIYYTEEYTVDDYDGHSEDFLSTNGEYNDGFNQLKQAKEYGSPSGVDINPNNLGYERLGSFLTKFIKQF